MQFGAFDALRYIVLELTQMNGGNCKAVLPYFISCDLGHWCLGELALDHFVSSSPMYSDFGP